MQEVGVEECKSTLVKKCREYRWVDYDKVNQLDESFWCQPVSHVGDTLGVFLYFVYWAIFIFRSMIQASMEESIIFEPIEEVESDVHTYGHVLYKMELILSLLEILFIDTKPGEHSRKKCGIGLPAWWQCTALTEYKVLVM